MSNEEPKPKSVYETRGIFGVGGGGTSGIYQFQEGLVLGGSHGPAALALSSVWCAVRVISEAVGSLPVHLYAAAEAERKREREHPLAALLADPCPLMTRPVFFETLQSHALLFGTAYAEIVRGQDGVQPAYLLPLHPRCVSVSQTAEGDIVYVIDYPDATRRTVRSEDMVCVPGLSPDGSVGYRILDVARDTVGFGLAATRHGTAIFRNLVRPSGVLDYPGQLPDDKARANIRKLWQTLHSGEQAGTVAIIEEGMKFTPFVYGSNEQAQYVELLQFFVYEVARLFNILPTKLHSIQSATYSGNLESLNSSFVSETLGPWVGKW